MASINGIKCDKVVRDENEVSYQRNGKEVYVETLVAIPGAMRSPELTAALEKSAETIPAPAKSKAQRKREAKAQTAKVD